MSSYISHNRIVGRDSG